MKKTGGGGRGGLEDLKVVTVSGDSGSVPISGAKPKPKFSSSVPTDSETQTTVVPHENHQVTENQQPTAIQSTFATPYLNRIQKHLLDRIHNHLS